MGALDYDPAERRERYLRERQLKGRDKGSEDVPASAPKPAAAPPPKDRQAARAAAAARVKALNGKLVQLRAALQAARKKSADKPSAAEQKSKDEKYNEQYYEKNKLKLANDRKAEARATPSKSGGSSKSTTSAPSGVEEIEAAIRSTLTQLKTAIARLKSL